MQALTPLQGDFSMCIVPRANPLGYRIFALPAIRKTRTSVGTSFVSSRGRDASSFKPSQGGTWLYRDPTKTLYPDSREMQSPEPFLIL